MSKAKGTDSHTYCIFQQPWWLDAVAPDSWEAVEIEKNGKVWARLPYVMEQKMGLKLLMMPPLTQTLGPWFIDMPGKYATRLSQQKDLYTELFEQLPPFDYFKHNFHYSIYNWLPLYWMDYSQTTRYTYVLEGIEDLETVWDEFDGSTRREIRKAEKQLEVSREEDPELMWKMFLKTFDRQDEDPGFPFGHFENIYKACRQKEAGQIFVARDGKNRVHATLFLVWDEHSAYYLMGGADPELRTSGASSLLMWEAIRFASQFTDTFDFEGSMIEPIERFFRGFGGRQKAYFQITKMSKKMKLLMKGKETFQSFFD